MMIFYSGKEQSDWLFQMNFCIPYNLKILKFDVIFPIWVLKLYFLPVTGTHPEYHINHMMLYTKAIIFRNILPFFPDWRTVIQRNKNR